MTINDGGPAFPHQFEDLRGHPRYLCAEGLTVRDWFAGQFLAGSAADSAALDVSAAADQHDIDAALRDYWDQVARTAYIAADSMLAARSKGSA